MKIAEWMMGKLLGRKRCYLQACAAYQNPAANLQGPMNDLALVRQEAESRGYAVKTQTDQQVSRATMRAFLERAVADAKAGKRVRVWMSGHGSRTRDRSGDEADGLDGGIVAWDLSLFLDDEVAAILEKLPPQADFALFLDICHAGEFPRGLDAPRVRAIPSDWLRKTWDGIAPRASLRAVDTAGVVAACRSEQYSLEARTANGKVQGLFTWHAIAAVRGAGVRLTLRDLARETARRLAKAGYAQSPQVVGRGELPVF